MVGAKGGGGAEGAGQRAEHPNDFSALVVDDGTGCFVPEHRHGADVPLVGPCWIGPTVDGFEVVLAVDTVGSGAGFIGVERPRTVWVHSPVNHINRNMVFQSEEGAGHDGSMRPRTGMRDVEMVASAGRLKRPFG